METRSHSLTRLTLRAEDLGKDFNRRPVFRELTFDVSSGEALAVTGKNGAGKSTLVKILSGLLTPTKGKVVYQADDAVIGIDVLRPRMGFVSPYLQLYDEFSALENLEVLSRIRSTVHLPQSKIESMFRIFDLWHRRHDDVRTFSSGMKQRLKYILALAHEPLILFLDEPTANLDDDGADAVRTIALEVQQSSILVVATNDEREAVWCGKRVHVGP